MSSPAVFDSVLAAIGRDFPRRSAPAPRRAAGQRGRVRISFEYFSPTGSRHRRPHGAGDGDRGRPNGAGPGKPGMRASRSSSPAGSTGLAGDGLRHQGLRVRAAVVRCLSRARKSRRCARPAPRWSWARATAVKCDAGAVLDKFRARTRRCKPQLETLFTDQFNNDDALPDGYRKIGGGAARASGTLDVFCGAGHRRHAGRRVTCALKAGGSGARIVALEPA